MKTLLVPFPDNLPPELALAFLDLLQDLSQALWDQYRTELTEHIMAESDPVPPPRQPCDFDDDLQF